MFKDGVKIIEGSPESLVSFNVFYDECARAIALHEQEHKASLLSHLSLIGLF